MTDPNCWEWDSYLNTCVRLHKVPWYDYANVWSISATFALIATAVVTAWLSAFLIFLWKTS